MMGSSIVDALSQAVSPDMVSKIGQTLGANKGAVGAVAVAAIPLLISALARNASNPKGAQDLHAALSNDHDGSILDNLNGHLDDPQAANGTGILTHVLGDQQGAIEQQLGTATGLDPNAVGQILSILAPVVMGAVGQATSQQGLNAGGLAGLLGNAQQQAVQQAQQTSPDVAGLIGTLLGGPGTQGSGGSLGGILGSLFGKK
jgi:hypothetical protein